MYVLATGAAEPDQTFASLRQLAAHIVAVRRRTPHRDIRLGPAEIGRDALPNGVAVSVRLTDGTRHGDLIGWAFLPIETREGDGLRFGPEMQRRLMAALVIAEAEAAPARAPSPAHALNREAA